MSRIAKDQVCSREGDAQTDLWRIKTVPLTSLSPTRERSKGDLPIPQRTTGRHLLAALTLIAVLAGISPAAARNVNHGVIPPHDDTYGKSYEEWSVAWYRWEFSLPATNHPVLDETGADCDRGQQGKVWFVAGLYSFTGQTEATRDCAIPDDKAVIFSILNFSWDNVPEDYPTSSTLGLTKQELTALCKASVRKPHTLAITLDGRKLLKLEDYAIKPTLFTYTMNADSLYNAVYGVPFSGESPSPGAVECGYYLMLAPLSAGTHTLNIGHNHRGIRRILSAMSRTT
jgi:hypothetical protein